MRYQSPADQQRESDLRFYREMRKGNECLCENSKQPGMWFCYRCYKALPADLQRRLFGAMTDDMMDAYNEAVKYLGD